MAMNISIQTPNGLLRLSPEVTSQTIIDALGYIPANQVDIDNAFMSDSDTFYVVDKFGNIISKIDKDGITTTAVNANTAKLNTLEVTDIITNTDEFVLTDSEGKEIDSSKDTGPLQYIHGNGYLIKGLESQLEGKEPGSKFTAFVEAKDAYGVYDEKLVIDVPRTQFDTSVEIEVGMQFQAAGPMGPTIVTVKKVSDQNITVDANHELAGKVSA